MVEETLSSPVPLVDNQSGLGGKTQTTGERAAVAKKSASVTSDAKVGKKQKLVSHLLIGFLMTVITLAGYAFLGPHAHASTADPAGNHFVDQESSLPPQTVSAPAIDNHSQISDLAALQAEMDAINRQMNALKAGNISNDPVGMSSNTAGNTTDNNTTRYSPDPVSARLDQMTAMLNVMMSMMNSMNTQTGGTQTGGMSTPMSGSGHLGHH
jgi:hypothetical protein